MSRTFTNLLTHLIFSTKDRRPLIRDDVRQQLHAYIVGILENHQSPSLETNSEPLSTAATHPARPECGSEVLNFYRESARTRQEGSPEIVREGRGEDAKLSARFEAASRENHREV